MAQPQTDPIAQRLLDGGRVTAEQVATARGRQRELGGSLGTALLEAGAITEDELLQTLAEHSSLPPAPTDELRHLPPPVAELLPAKVAIRHRAIPFRAGRGRISVAVEQEPEIPVLDELAFVAGRRVLLHVASEARIEEALARFYGADCPARLTHLLDRLNHPLDHPAEPEAVPANPSARPKRRPAPAPPAPSAPSAATVARRPPPPRPTSVPLSANEKKALRRLASREEVKPLSQDGIQKALQEARHADDIGAALVGFLGQEFLRLMLFRIGQGKVRGWMGRSPALDEYGFRNWAAGFDEPSVFLNLRQGAELFLGRLPAMPAHERLIKCWRGSLDTECAVFPVKVRDRLICAIYGDRDSLGLAGLDVRSIQRLTAKAAIAFEMLLMQRKLRS